EPIPLPERGYHLDWEGESQGLTAAVATSGESLFISSYEELQRQPAHLGAWDEYLYPYGVDDADTGFGCLYAVPLKHSTTGVPRETVAGVFKIERRNQRRPFSDGDRELFDLVANHLSQVLRAYRQLRDVDTEEVPDDLQAKIDASFPIRQMQVWPVERSNYLETVAALPADEREVIERSLETVRQGFAGIPVEEGYKEEALTNLGQWLVDPTLGEYRPQLLWLIEQERWALLLDSFYRVLPFGTGGRRGPVGIGTNRFNVHTLASSVQGHVNYLREENPDGNLSVVVVFDVRKFHDIHGLYNPELDNPLLGMSSRDFAHAAVAVYTANAVRVHILPEDSPRYVSTPELVFTIRSLGASAGLNISASHNHPDDNGGKFYNRLGGQDVPPNDDRMARVMRRVPFLTSLALEHAKEDLRLVSWISDEVHEDYVQLNVGQSLAPRARQARIVFTPLHGTGDTTVGTVLRRAGFQVDLVAEQATDDGAFPTVPYRVPNPEVRESMDRAIELAKKVGADLVMSCDPDADRIGVCSATGNGAFQFLTGDEIAVLVTHYKLERMHELDCLPANPLVIKTEVTTELLRLIVEHFGATLIGDLLVGFKYHGHVLEQIEKQGSFRSMPFDLEDFIVGVEESHGILVTTELRDKDAAGAAILLAELASLQRSDGRTLVDYLNDIYRRFGYYSNRLISMVMVGVEGVTNIEKIQEALRGRPPERIAGRRVTEVIDHWDQSGIHGEFLSETDRAARNVLGFRLEDGSRLTLRPSGTEPKNKIYVEVPSAPLGRDADDDALVAQKAQTDAAVLELADDLTRQMLAVIGVRLPDYALRISGLVPLDRRIDFVENFLPKLEARVQASDEDDTSAQVAEWIDEHLASYGRDARGLVAEAFEQYLSGERAKVEPLKTPEAAQRRGCLDAMQAAFSKKAT
ncbi:MAG: phospho-sugar mutase, partial [Acidobacteria bacterium]|nr:phospho-sugar mutase [Acidobacteriota bacterium]